MKRLNQTIVFMVLAGIALSACQTLGVPTPETFNQRIAVGYSSVTTARDSARVLLQAEKISPEEAQQIQAQTDNCRAALDIARTMHATDPKGAETKLSAVLVGLHALDGYLQYKKGPDSGGAK